MTDRVVRANADAQGVAPAPHVSFAKEAETAETHTRDKAGEHQWKLDKLEAALRGGKGRVMSFTSRGSSA